MANSVWVELKPQKMERHSMGERYFWQGSHIDSGMAKLYHAVGIFFTNDISL